MRVFEENYDTLLSDDKQDKIRRRVNSLVSFVRMTKHLSENLDDICVIEESLKIFNSLASRARIASRLCCVGCSNVLSTNAYYLDVTLGEESGLHYMHALLKPACHGGLLNSLT